MPWTKSDVEKHIKGLTDKQKERWVRVANAALRKCEREGGGNCDAVAIRQANSVVQNNKDMDKIIDVYFYTTQPQYVAKKEQFDGIPYIVVPVTMMVEGVHNGSHGPVLHLAEELGRFPEAWNGIPVTVNHPQTEGMFVSANSPDVLKDWAIGKVFNTHINGDKLQAEVWIEESRLQNNPELLQRVNNGDVIEVSVGVFSDEEDKQGEHNGETYEAIARNHRPDHLALLPAETGACSVIDGCGIRVNKKGGSMVIVNDENQKQVFKELTRKGFSINQTGFKELASKVQTCLDGMDNENSVHYLEEIFQNEVVYRKHMKEDETKYYKQSYVENAEGNVELTGNAVQVKKQIDYVSVPVANAKKKEVTINTNKKGDTMSEKKDECTPCVKKAVDALIANKATAYTEEVDREWLESLTEEQLEKMSPIVNEQEVTVDKALEVLQKSDLKVDDYMKGLPEEVRQQVERGLAIHQEKVDSMISEIMDNKKDVWEKEELEAMEFTVLEKLHKTAQNTEVANYSAMSVASKKDEVRKVEPMPASGIKFKEN